MQVRQDEYDGGFDHCLKQSRYLTQWICKTLDDADLFPNVYCQDQFDQFPFVGNGGQKTRFADVFVFDFNSDGGPYFIEAKDFGAAIFHDCTGLPRRYIDERMIPLGQRHVYMVFRENKETISQRIKHKKKLFFTEVNGSKYKVIPYGERLDILMRNRNAKAEEKVKSKLSSYYDQPQYMWNLPACKPMIEVFLRDFGSTGGRNEES